MSRAPSNMVVTKPQDLFWLVDRMRPDEAEQLHAFYDMQGQADVLRFFLNKTGPAFTILDAKGIPVCAGGWESVTDGVMQSWMLGSMEAWDEHWRSITKGARWLMEELLYRRGIRRLQTNALASRAAACDWYVKGLRMEPEGVWRKFGRQGQDVACFARVAEEN